MYLKTTYKNDPIFKDTKTVFTVYDNAFKHKFGSDLLEKVKMFDIEDSLLNSLKTADFEGFIKIGSEYADAVIKAEDSFSDSLNQEMSEVEKEKRIATIESNDDFCDSYYNLYNELVG